MTASAASYSRIYRLCLKELRESLRDRRTIVTLVLMPLLVYPLLSMILQRLLLTSAQPQSSLVLRIGITDATLEPELEMLIQMGRQVIAANGEILTVRHASSPRSDSSESGDVSATSPNRGPERGPVGNGQVQREELDSFHAYQMFLIEGDPAESLRNGSVDVILRDAPPRTFAPPGTGQLGTGQLGTGQLGTGQLSTAPSVPGTSSTESAPQSSAQSSAPTTPESTSPGKQDPPAESARTNGNPTGADDDTTSRRPSRLRYQIDYVEKDPHSERAVRFFQGLFAAVNDQTIRDFLQQTGGRYRPAVRMTAAPIEIKNNSPSVLASLVPLVLVLMTIAGAVYPAIDLTAGERERGTLEAMIVSPTPRPILLLSKYVAVVTVALLTAIANLVAMSVTLWASGLGKLVFGEGQFSFLIVLQILCLLILFAMFFSAVLLAITSFAKSFKEAQAYLIPVMLVSLAPGVLSLLPQIRLTNFLGAVPLANIVLLSRDLLLGTVSWEAGGIAIMCTTVYALAAIVIASRLFGSDASLQGSQGSWRDLFTRPVASSRYPTIDQTALMMAILFPLYFVSSTSLPGLGGSLTFRLMASAFVSWALIFGLPTLIAAYRRVDFEPTFLLKLGRFQQWLLWLPAVLLLGGSLWMFAHEMMMFLQQIGFATFGPEQMKMAEAFAAQLPDVALGVILFTGALTPAICEEWFFRGFVMSSLRRLGMWGAICGSAFLFGMMHVLTSNMVAIERFFPSAMMGLVLGWVAWRTGSILPGMILHALHNGFLLSLGHFKQQLTDWGIGVAENTHLPALWLGGAIVSVTIGVGLFLLAKPAELSAKTSAESPPR